MRHGISLALILAKMVTAAEIPSAMLSPKLRAYIGEHPPAAAQLSTVWETASRGRSIQLYYFYSDDKSEARAVHYYPQECALVIAIRENQEPLDELLCIIFEAENSLNQPKFESLMKRASGGRIKKSEFVTQMLENEFQAVLRMKSMLTKLDLSFAETTNSYYFRGFDGAPDSAKDFAEYCKKVSAGKRDPAREAGEQYEKLRKK